MTIHTECKRLQNGGMFSYFDNIPDVALMCFLVAFGCQIIHFVFCVSDLIPFVIGC